MRDLQILYKLIMHKLIGIEQNIDTQKFTDNKYNNMQQYQLKHKNQTNYQNLNSEVTYKLIKLLINAKTLDEKVAYSKSAILSKRLRARPLYTDLQQQKHDAHKIKLLANDVFVKTQDISPKQETNADQSQTGSKNSYLKQTHQIQTQTQNQQKYYGECSFAQIELQQSKVSIYSKNQQDIKTCCSFSNGLNEKQPKLMRKITFDQKVVSNEFETQVGSLRGQIISLKSQIQIIDKQKNKWKKKALKYSQKFEKIESQQQRFEKAYKQTTKKQ